VLLGLTGLRIDGGIASVSRCVAQALDEEVRVRRVARTDRILLLEEPGRAAPAPVVGEQLLSRGSQPRFIWQAWRSFRRHRHELVIFDLVGLARSTLLPLPGFPPPRFAIFVHGIELEAATAGSRARALREASRILANSQFTAEKVRKAFPELADRLRVVPLCVDPERVAAWEALSPATLHREPAALIVGRLSSEERGKGHDELLEAWPSVRQAVPGAELWIAGGGDDAPRLEARVRDLGVGGAVRMFGRVSDATLADLYRRASVYAMPSRQEGFGLTYAEAMWFGLPCLGATADAAGQVIVDGETGSLVPYGDVGAIARALIEMLSEPERARRLGDAARRHARQRFGYDRFRSDLLTALDLL
jgi:phosphatidylinositol alpha-1,6-mannosyltransferase